MVDKDINNNGNLTYKWLVPLLIIVIGSLSMAWLTWTNERITMGERERAQLFISVGILAEQNQTVTKQLEKINGKLDKMLGY